MKLPQTPSEAIESPEQVTAVNVDLSNCDRELVQYSGAVQPHGALVVVTEPELQIVQVSANTATWFGRKPEDLLGRVLTDLLGDQQTGQVRQRLAREALVNVPPVHVLRATVGTQHFHVFAHQIDGVLVLEFESAGPERPVADLYGQVRAVIARLQATRSLQDFFDLAVTEIRHFTGFGRVMAYEFLPDGSGHVMAESVEAGLEPYLGLHYPASDIPQPARRLFSLTWLRHLPDVDYAPVPLIPPANPATQAPLDLSYVAGRHVSVMYSRYLQNMGVKATMVITLLKNGQLWGLISCMNHDRPKHLPYEERLACEFLAHMVSMLMASKQDEEFYEQRMHLDAVMDRVLQAVSRSHSVVTRLIEEEPELLQSVQATGAAVVWGNQVKTAGVTPSEPQIKALAQWLLTQEGPVFVTDRLPAVYPAAAEYQDKGSGLLTARLSRSGSELVLWFRPELITTVSWAGDPNKPVEVTREGQEIHLSPRTSFELWQEQVRGRSAPWQLFEVQAVREVRESLMEIVVDRTKELERINRELEMSNFELDSFAYVASHDLKEPLRGIHNYSVLLQRSAGERLSDSERSRLETVTRLSQRLDDLIEGLLHYSRVGRTDLVIKLADLNEVVRNALDLLRSRVEQSGAIVRSDQLPTMMCDRVRLREVYFNLILNALKYNDREEKHVDIGVHDGPVPVFYVRDNGIGIGAENLEEIFKIFKRLHGRDEYGGGTGAGLTIARRTVERHGGRMWVESTPGEGTTFYFTLSSPQGEGDVEAGS